MTDEELVAQAREGHGTAFDQLVERHYAAAYRAALAALRHHADAEEATQDGFVLAWYRLKSFQGQSSFRTWLLAIVWKQALNRRRSLRSWFRRRARLEEGRRLASNAPDVEGGLRGRELREHAARAIEALSPKLRDALLLACSGEYDYAEIAELLGVSPGTVKWRVSEARRKVRERLALLGYANAR